MADAKLVSLGVYVYTLNANDRTIAKGTALQTALLMQLVVSGLVVVVVVVHRC